ncbi:hypothetical protein ANTPLA_LOCUS5728 [Anthophora plagiata]
MEMAHAYENNFTRVARVQGVGQRSDNATPFAHLAPQDYCNFAIFQQDKGLLISRPERAALLFGTLRDRINAALTSRLRDYPNYSSTWDLMQVRLQCCSLNVTLDHLENSTASASQRFCNVSSCPKEHVAKMRIQQAR